MARGRADTLQGGARQRGADLLSVDLCHRSGNGWILIEQSRNLVGLTGCARGHTQR